MKKISLVTAALTALFAIDANAQADNNDINTFSQALTVDVPTLAMLDIEDASGAEVSAITLDLTDVTKEAGVYEFDSVETSPMWLNYTSVVADGQLRNITVGFDQNANDFPGGVKLVLNQSTFTADNGTLGTAAGAIEVKPTDVSVPVITGIGSVYTGQGQKGLQFTYSLAEDGSFADYKAGTYNSTLIYTISGI